jgi:DNA-binding MarR family transcriptional regulator
MAEKIDIGEIAGCTCLLARRATRQLTQIYDAALEPAGLTVNQFGVLALLYGSTLGGRGPLSVGALADLVGKHASTLNRDLKPLGARGLVADMHDPTDRRIRTLSITAKGRALLRKAIPSWRKAEAQIRKSLGAKMMLKLHRLLEAASAALEEDRA